MIQNVDNKIVNAINLLTQKVSTVLVSEFLKLPEDYKVNFVMIKSLQLLLAHVLCHAASDLSELEKLMDLQGREIKELTTTCSYTGFAEKFSILRH